MNTVALLFAIILAQATTCRPTPVTLVKQAPMSHVYPDPAAPSGQVIFAVVVDAHGLVKAAYVKKSTGSAAYDRAALQSARNSVYKPATMNCKPIEATYRLGLAWATSY
jgi:TonB family protein